MDFDEQGRLWVTQSSGISDGCTFAEKERIKITILEDTDGDGKGR